MPNFSVSKYSVRPSYINKKLGKELSTATQIKCLEQNRLGVTQLKEDLLEITVPCYRTDILHPIDFVAFNGMNKGQVQDVTLLSNKTNNPHIQNFHNAIAEAVKEERYDWKVLRVSQDGEVEYN